MVDIRFKKSPKEKMTISDVAKIKEREQKEISKAHKQALREEQRREKLKTLKTKRQEQISQLEEKKEVARQKAEIRRLKQETSATRGVKTFYEKMKERQKAIQSRARQPTTTTRTRKPKTKDKLYLIKGEYYRYTGTKFIKVPISKKTKKKKDEITI
jgi:hypothetical protein